MDGGDEAGPEGGCATKEPDGFPGSGGQGFFSDSSMSSKDFFRGERSNTPSGLVGGSGLMGHQDAKEDLLGKVGQEGTSGKGEEGEVAEDEEDGDDGDEEDGDDGDEDEEDGDDKDEEEEEEDDNEPRAEEVGGQGRPAAKTSL